MWTIYHIFLSGNNKKKDNEGTRVDYLIKINY